jgi:hypothetical protein
LGYAGVSHLFHLRFNSANSVVAEQRPEKEKNKAGAFGMLFFFFYYYYYFFFFFFFFSFPFVLFFRSPLERDYWDETEYGYNTVTYETPLHQAIKSQRMDAVVICL